MTRIADQSLTRAYAELSREHAEDELAAIYASLRVPMLSRQPDLLACVSPQLACAASSECGVVVGPESRL